MSALYQMNAAWRLSSATKGCLVHVDFCELEVSRRGATKGSDNRSSNFKPGLSWYHCRAPWMMQHPEKLILAGHEKPGNGQLNELCTMYLEDDVWVSPAVDRLPFSEPQDGREAFLHPLEAIMHAQEAFGSPMRKYRYGSKLRVPAAKRAAYSVPAFHPRIGEEP